MTSARTFRTVWYRSQPLRATEPALKAMEDRGSLDVLADQLIFRGKTKEVEITGIHRVSAHRHGRDFINRWITVAYGDGKTAMFVDSGLLGWKGILGGNKRLLHAIEQAAAG
jgi:hypothetical protein